MGFYVQKTDEPNRSGLAQEDIKAGTLVHLRATGAFLSNAGDGDEGYMGVADTPRRGDYIADEVDDASSFVYKATDSEALSGAHRVPVAGYADGDIVAVRTVLETTDGVTSAPSISHNDIVGYLDYTDADAPSSEGRLVEEGYSNDENNDAASTTFDRATGNFVAIGRAYMPELEGAALTEFDGLVRVVVNKSLEN